MFWSKKIKCGECGDEYSGTQYAIEQDSGAKLILCEKCYNNFIEEDARKIKKEAARFETKKNSMKYSYKEYCEVDFNKKSSEINLEIEIFSDKKLTKIEKESQTNSYQTKIPLIKEYILSAKKGDIVFRLEVNILPADKNIKPIDIEEITLDTEKMRKKLFNEKPKKSVIIIIKKLD